MGRHRRSAAGRAATGRATGVTEAYGSFTGSQDPRDSYAGRPAAMGIAPYLNPEAYAEANARSSAYLYSTDDEYGRVTETTAFPAGGFTPAGGSSGGGHRRRKKKAATPVRTGLLGVSAAVAIGTVTVATGVVPGLDNFKLGGTTSTSGGDNVQAAGSPGNTAAEQGGTSGSAADGRAGGSGDASTSRNSDRSVSPAPSAPASSAPAPAKTHSKEPKAPATPSKKPKTEPTKKAPKAPARSSAPATVSTAAAAEAQVLKLVNEERAKVGCSAVSANSSLTALASAFSDDMAARGFFDHTDPDGATPWDRAAKAGISGLGGENIARGQADAAAVMEAWMNSPGHRANILNCDFKTLGVGVHFGADGPWWTQDFGY
ncbi:CAP domain-containing protein [Streptomyces sp. NPDC058964]|uniref:CAP domain-containing protein n=1 Tax=Streptomyces sp. NPDC058964 TaxID=3346681 RepID=UPI0036902973